MPTLDPVTAGALTLSHVVVGDLGGGSSSYAGLYPSSITYPASTDYPGSATTVSPAVGLSPDSGSTITGVAATSGSLGLSTASSGSLTLSPA